LLTSLGKIIAVSQNNQILEIVGETKKSDLIGAKRRAYMVMVVIILILMNYW